MKLSISKDRFYEKLYKELELKHIKEGKVGCLGLPIINQEDIEKIKEEVNKVVKQDN